MIQTVQDTAEKIFTEIQREFPQIELSSYESKINATLETREAWTDEQVWQLLLNSAVERITSEEPDWTFVAARLHLQQLYKQAASTRGEQTSLYGNFLHLLQLLTEEGIYTPQLLASYTEEEIYELSQVIDPSKDQLFTYIGIVTLSERYLARTLDKQPAELPQERWLVIAMTLMMNEPKAVRLQYVKEAYWALSNLYMTTATPTLANAGKSYGQLSSCFIDTIDDSLQGIFDANTDAANLSKNGGGLGIYLGKIRSQGSDIRGFKNVSSGVIPWMKQLNNTAVSVDQLGQRQGAIAVYLDVWHRDIFSFLETRLNNGDERRRTHDLFTGVAIPDLFMEAVEKREEWHLFDPHEVRKIMGYSLEDSFDEKRGEGTFRTRYKECVNHPDLSKKTVPAIDIMKAIMISQLETGTPYMFYRDTVNRANPNKHAGMIYASNLCTEICQNMSPTVVLEEKSEDGKILITKDPGDYVVCNLSSVSLARAVMDDVLERLIPIQVRMLDNVIEINSIPVLQAQLTNQKYRGIGLGTFGWQHLLALKGLSWESDEAVRYCDELYERLSFLTIQASAELAAEKGAYPIFSGSDWESGAYFEQRGYTSSSWQKLKNKVKENGIRNGYLLAVAPNSSTALIAGSTAGIDPVFRKEYMEEKKNYKIPVTAPDLSPQTTWYYKTVYLIDQHWSIRQNAKRQRHIDQAVSFNLYVRNDIKAKALLDLHVDAWNSGLKTTYYVRSTASDIEECESCHS
ncbi:ribonucleoside-diphosphate reductase subunit alpha [Bacillus badius]|uniref:Ribonucleoside-diphosphate reductase n=1 Tax=Bacillus badius TaxID=1455 RepID=A0ABR5AXC9_BACBA|nr:ribonucleoside-diphosphate reductase subunit alpha [Bacillus badius]KIL74521.1 Ribonucleotide reductase of class Ia (aerobic), alpha subunit [Bacillus badius]KIL78991.1 Ribonucleotide reductase of class Ia (aerobic), alpha subunit [Bacillus badius]KZR58827.1 ribonucleotide-diphosphate reductase subunit alpha [Bacillus badius]MED4715570.1 ribonucleoside-diphosphate reductase subunit alpha [Bacillus badius]